MNDATAARERATTSEPVIQERPEQPYTGTRLSWR
jgi:hypothetical protein